MIVVELCPATDFGRSLIAFAGVAGVLSGFDLCSASGSGEGTAVALRDVDREGNRFLPAVVCPAAIVLQPDGEHA